MKSDADKILKNFRETEARYRRDLKKPFDPDFGGESERSDIKADIRALERKRQLPRDMVCPSCLVQKKNTRQWTADGRSCRACKDIQEGIRPVKIPSSYFVNLFSDGENDRFEYDNKLLRRIRIRLGVSTRDFGFHCKWAGTYQARLERTEEAKLSIKSKTSILRTILLLNDAEFRLDTEDKIC